MDVDRAASSAARARVGEVPCPPRLLVLSLGSGVSRDELLTPLLPNVAQAFSDYMCSKSHPSRAHIYQILDPPCRLTVLNIGDWTRFVPCLLYSHDNPSNLTLHALDSSLDPPSMHYSSPTVKRMRGPPGGGLY